MKDSLEVRLANELAGLTKSVLRSQAVEEKLKKLVAAGEIPEGDSLKVERAFRERAMFAIGVLKSLLQDPDADTERPAAGGLAKGKKGSKQGASKEEIARSELIELGAVREKAETWLGDTFVGWWRDGVYLGKTARESLEFLKG